MNDEYDDDDVSYDYDDESGRSFWSDEPKRLNVAEQKSRAIERIAELRLKSPDLNPVVPKKKRGKLALSHWGAAWCQYLEKYKDMDYRLDRGRSYIRNSCLLDLQITPQKVIALVSGSEIYEVEICFDKLEAGMADVMAQKCSEEIESVVDLLCGKFSDTLMKYLISEDAGLFPDVFQIKFSCNCLDYADVCKHVATTLYGIGVCFDSEPDLFFKLRGIETSSLLKSTKEVFVENATNKSDLGLGEDEMGDLFGLDFE